MKTQTNYYNILKHFTIGIDVLFAFMLLFNYLGFLPEFWNMNMIYVFYGVVAVNTCFFAFKINSQRGMTHEGPKIPEKGSRGDDPTLEVGPKDSKMIYYFSHFFLLSLVVIALNQFLKRQIIIDNLGAISAVAIAFGFLTFYAYRNKVEKEIEDEKVGEEKAEKKRLGEFDKKFKWLKFFDFNYGIGRAFKEGRYFFGIFRVLISPIIWVWRLPYTLGKWVYKEGWLYSALFILLVVLFLGLRLYSLDYIDGSDNYNDVAIKALYENGHSFYNYSIITTQLMLLSVKMFGFNFPALKLPFIFYSLITIIFIYFISKFINKKVALLSMFLFAISPWSIILSKVTRDYAFDCMIGSIVLYLGICIYQKTKNKDIKKNFYNLLYLFLLFVSVYVLSKLNIRPQMLLVLIFPFIIGIFIIYNLLKDYLNRTLKPLKFLRASYFSILLFVMAVCFYFVKSSPFIKGYLFDRFYFDVFFNPLIGSPWQWFQDNVISILLVFSFFLLPILFNFLNYKKKDLVNIFYSIFFFGISLYLFKFESYLKYNPTRYIYFLFPIYCILFSLSIFYFIKNYKKMNFQKLLVILTLIILFFNFTSINYAINPIKAYEKDGISNLQIDNIGTGRFKMEAIISFIKKNDPNLEEIYVISGRFDEFILLLDWPIDQNRGITSYERMKYDVGKNMFIESSYFDIYELEIALKKYPYGYFITEENSIYYGIDKEYTLEEKDIKYNGFFLEFMGCFNNYKVYKWDI